MTLFITNTWEQFTYKNNDLEGQTVEISVTHSFSAFMIWLSCSINSSSKDVNKECITYYHYPNYGQLLQYRPYTTTVITEFFSHLTWIGLNPVTVKWKVTASLIQAFSSVKNNSKKINSVPFLNIMLICTLKKNCT